jgi:hypothetical protein
MQEPGCTVRERRGTQRSTHLGAFLGAIPQAPNTAAPCEVPGEYLGAVYDMWQLGSAWPSSLVAA